MSDLVEKGIIQKEHLLSDYSTWKVGGVADFFSAPKSVQELIDVLTWAREEKQLVTIFSGGSNVLFSDAGVRGLAIGMSCINGTEVEETKDRVHLTSWAGSSKGELLKYFLQYNLDPALFLAGLPGDVGGGVTMNAGVGDHQPAPREFCEIVDWVEVLRWSEKKNAFETVLIEAKDLVWSYRHCEGWQPGIIIRVGVSWPNTPNAEVRDIVRSNMKRRLQSQPLDLANCGSVFRNPPGEKSGALIEECELKGFQVGEAQVSLKHANFIVNLGGASARDIDSVIRHVQGEVQARKGISLQTEVVYLGEW